jgi:hypothetical protein
VSPKGHKGGFELGMYLSRVKKHLKKSLIASGSNLEIMDIWCVVLLLHFRTRFQSVLKSPSNINVLTLFELHKKTNLAKRIISNTASKKF